MTLLALETATDVCSVALLQETQVIVELTLARPRAHAENLVTLIRDALQYGGVTVAAVDAVAVSQGPGSYTGLRIGASTAKGLATAVDAQLVPVPSLEALAAAAAGGAAPGDLIGALFQARRDEVYAAAFRVTDTGAVAPEGETVALAVEEVPAWLPDAAAPLWLVGEGAASVAPALQAAGRAVHLLPPEHYRPSAAWVARLARTRLAEGRVADVAAFEPFYLKEFVAKKPRGSAFERLPF